MLSEELIIKLKKLAAEELVTFEDECVEDYACGNVDDAFNFGVNQGQLHLAREILDNLDIPYETYD